MLIGLLGVGALGFWMWRRSKKKERQEQLDNANFVNRLNRGEVNIRVIVEDRDGRL